MVTLHEVITFLVSMQISISSLQTHNVNRCGRSRHLARKLSLRRKRSSPNVFEMAATETITSIILIKLIRVSLGTVRHPRRFKIVVIDIQITLKQMLRDFIGIRVNRAKKSGMVNITSSVNSRERSGINTILHELNPIFFFNDTATTKIYTLSLHDALPISRFSENEGQTEEKLAAEISAALDEVQNLDEDRILRSFLAVIQATTRTNCFQGGKTYLSLKLDPKRVPGLPDPRPMFEVWVYSPQVEAVHLRGGPVARGGIRWSDRMEDFRTEVLGLMKAQMVKNVVIVPVGAKGGFVVKQPPPAGDREALMKEGVACYQTFLRGLLDVTDNLVDGKIVPPRDVVRHDGDDPYLVVAADKGTATFSDIANAVAAEYGFWLGDAFASGGSAGYDHKKMAITARGAWESVKRHFRELGVNTQTTDFTVAGIGDMSGDVFGNGMLLSRHIKLVAAFDHRHIFLDPDPDTEASFKERERLFKLPRSSWADYDAKLISRGGGVFPRTAKSIPLSSESQKILG